jgi:hypothetical protein
MTIEEIKSEIQTNSICWWDETAESLILAIEFLEDAAKHYNVPEGKRAIACLKAIENKFSN